MISVAGDVVVANLARTLRDRAKGMRSYDTRAKSAHERSQVATKKRNDAVTDARVVVLALRDVKSDRTFCPTLSTTCPAVQIS